MREAADPLLMLERIAAGDVGPDVFQWLRGCCSTWLLSGGAVPLERCMHLPNTPKRIQLAQRNEWIRRAAALSQAQTAYAAAVAVEAELSRFLSRGPWAHWRHLQSPPEGASRMGHALFHVARLNDGQALSAKQIWRVVGRGFVEKCPPVGPTMETFNDHS